MFKPPYKNLRIWDFPNTEADCPSKHPGLGQKVPILDLSIWLEETNLPAPWMAGLEGGLHEKCYDDETGLPIGLAPTKFMNLKLEWRLLPYLPQG